MRQKALRHLKNILNNICLSGLITGCLFAWHPLFLGAVFFSRWQYIKINNMKNNKLEFAHWLILSVAICFYVIILAMAPNKKSTGQNILIQKYHPTHQDTTTNDPVIDVNAFVINGDTLANENI